MAQTVTDPLARDYSFLEDARRKSRFTAALARARKMAEGEPRFTPDQLATLAAVFTGAAIAVSQEPAESAEPAA
jgi:hypothetical protein